MSPRLPIDWHPVRTIPIVLPSASGQITQRPCRLYGFSFTEVTGSVNAAVQLLDGGNSGGALITDVALVPAESTRDWYGRPGILVESGLFLNVLSGSVRGSIWALLLTEEEIAYRAVEG